MFDFSITTTSVMGEVQNMGKDYNLKTKLALYVDFQRKVYKYSRERTATRMALVNLIITPFAEFENAKRMQRKLIMKRKQMG